MTCAPVSRCVVAGPWVIMAACALIGCATPSAEPVTDDSDLGSTDLGSTDVGDADPSAPEDARAGSGSPLPEDPPDAAPTPAACAAADGTGDSDLDGYGDGPGCAAPDCDDTNGAIHPGAFEACNGVDENCDGAIDEGLAQSACGTGACRTVVENCLEGRPQACVPAAPQAETCNGLDDNCDGTVDEEAGVTTCGAGLCERHADCVEGAEGPCTPGVPAAEACNGQDDDCDGVTDNGFRAVVSGPGYGVLRTHHDTCDGAGQRMGPGCNAAIHRFCVAQGCTMSGFGPVENSGDSAAVTCVAGGTDRQVSFAALAGIQPACDGAAQRLGPECNSAIHRYCRSEGFESGFGPIESGPDAVTVTCLPGASAQVVETSYGALSGVHGGCNQANFIGSDCNAAIHRFCAANGGVSGFGPVEHSGDTAVVVCVRP